MTGQIAKMHHLVSTDRALVCYPCALVRVTHMWYFVAVTVFVVSDCLFRLIELRLAIDVKRVVRAF